MPPNSPDVCPPRPASVHPGPPLGPVEATGISPLAARRPAEAPDDPYQRWPASQAVTRETTSPITPRLSTALSPCAADVRQGSKSPIDRKLDLPRIERTYAMPEPANKALAVPYPACDPPVFGR